MANENINIAIEQTLLVKTPLAKQTFL